VGLLLLGLLYAGPAGATDYLAPRLDAGLGHAGATFYELGLGFDVDFFAEYLGGRLGGVLSLHDFVATGSDGLRLLLSPEVAAHFGGDGDVLRLFVVLQPQLGLVGFDADVDFFHGLRAGPQVEWRDTPSGLRVSLALLYAPARDPGGDLDWTALAVRMSVAYAFGTESELEPPPGELCPDGLPPIEGYGCKAVQD
jgi:hypothetical protein